MENVYIRLSDLPLGRTGTVFRMPYEHKLRKQLMNLGMIYGTEIESVCKSPSGDPCAYSFRGTLMAIRKKDAEKIIIKFGE